MAAVAAVVVGSGAFYAGGKYAPARIQRGGVWGSAGERPDSSRAASEARQAPDAGAERRGRLGMRRGENLLNGEIIAADARSLTVKLRDGGSKIVFLSASTTIAKATNGQIADLVTGATVMISGIANPDGSLTAALIQLRPARP